MLTISIMRLKHSAVERKFESSKTNTNEDVIMPLVRIDISKTASKERIRAVSEAVYGAMVEIANVPLHDKFQIITRHADDEIIYPEEGYLGIEYSRDLIIIQITWVGGRAIDVKKKFLRNGGARGHLHGLENKSECLGAPMQIIDDSSAVACLVERRAGIDVLHSVPYGVIEQDCDLARRGRHRLGLADARREPPVECAQRGVGPSNSNRSKTQERRGPVPATACS